LKSPDHLNEKDKKAFESAWINVLLLVTNALTLAFVVTLFIFALVFTQPVFSKWKTEKPTVENERSQKVTPEIVDGIHVESGLVTAEGWELVLRNCTACHSGKLVTQNRASREGWEKMIRWMQESQGLWPLGEVEPQILDYLAANYAPQENSRRPNLDLKKIEWYILENK
jgi:hypothetical protein